MKPLHVVYLSHGSRKYHDQTRFSVLTLLHLLLQQQRQLLLLSWLHGHPVPWRWPEVLPALPRPTGGCEQTALAAPLAASLAQLQEERQLAQQQQQLSRMLLTGNAHYPQRLQSRRWGLAASIAMIGMLVALAALWRYRRS